MLSLHSCIKPAQGFLLLFIQPLRHLNDQSYIVIAANIAVSQRGNAFSSQADTGICLGSCLHLVFYFSVYSADTNRTAQCRCSKGNRNCGENTGILALKYRMLGYYCLYQQIAPLSAIDTRLSAACTANSAAFTMAYSPLTL